ncbi:hypothetical protein SAMD00019534_072450 [Acytostelium subglobosum LB1]|uniref:hypothetical protein n=1 Tax=Acytostelium subglobosum LB1 TaxID=1410327 RepID=UPI0006449564|nr:hypothetical protein SAMD00019534_072450 [Acytostelium subglobosum LB1]GAM24070.1 hypothetical protein SAMD00019534_072450 [Acytostelium subglobosum LB1]|eukprot:XP_012753106.1 hypothetical protein SAMD00019534_072450 [Acytostelium subglobosum LB1]
MKSSNFFKTFKLEVLSGVRELPLGFRTMIAEGVPATHPPLPRARIETLHSPVALYAREFAKAYPEIGYLEMDDPSEEGGDLYNPRSELVLSKRAQYLDSRTPYDSTDMVEEDAEFTEAEMELEMTQDAFNFANAKVLAMKKGLSEKQAHQQALRDTFNDLERRELELDIIRKQAKAMGIPAFDPQRHLQYLDSLYKTVVERRDEFRYIIQRDELEEALQLKKEYGENSPLTFDQVSKFSPEEFDQFIAEHPEYKDLLAQEITMNDPKNDRKGKKGKQAVEEKPAQTTPRLFTPMRVGPISMRDMEGKGFVEIMMMMGDNFDHPVAEIVGNSDENLAAGLNMFGEKYSEEYMEKEDEDDYEESELTLFRRFLVLRQLLMGLTPEELAAIKKDTGMEDIVEEVDKVVLESHEWLLEHISMANSDNPYFATELQNENGYAPSDYSLQPANTDNMAFFSQYIKQNNLLLPIFTGKEYDAALSETFTQVEKIRNDNADEMDKWLTVGGEDEDGETFQDEDGVTGSFLDQEVDNLKLKLKELDQEKWNNLDKAQFIADIFAKNRSPFHDMSVNEQGILTKTDAQDDRRDIFETSFVKELWADTESIAYPVACSREAINQLSQENQISPELAKYFNLEIKQQPISAEPLSNLNFYRSDLSNINTFQELSRFQDVPEPSTVAKIDKSKFNEVFERTLDQSLSSIYVDPHSANLEKHRLSNQELVGDLYREATGQKMEEESEESADTLDEESRNVLLMIQTQDKLASTTEKMAQLRRLFALEEHDKINELMEEKRALLGNNKTMDDYLSLSDAEFDNIQKKLSDIDYNIKRLQALSTLKENMAVRYSNNYRLQKAKAADRMRQLQEIQAGLEKRLARIEEAIPSIREMKKNGTYNKAAERAEKLYEGIAAVQENNKRKEILQSYELPVPSPVVQGIWPTVDAATKRRILAQYKEQKRQAAAAATKESDNQVWNNLEVQPPTTPAPKDYNFKKGDNLKQYFTSN